MNENNIVIFYGIYVPGSFLFDLKYNIESFYGYIIKKFVKFNNKYGVKALFYTIGIDIVKKVMAIAITHPLDDFDPKVGANIVRGRIKRMNGELENRLPYDPIPEYISIEIDY